MNKSAEFRAIKPSELDECLDLWGIVFERVGRGYFPPYFYGDPWFKPEYTRVAVVDGKIVSAVQICERRVRVGESEIVMGGIGNVGTYTEHRGHGYSTKLMEDTVRVMHENGIDFSVLFTGIQPFYERTGWRSVPQTMLAGRIKPDIKPIKGRYTIRESNWELDLPALQRIHNAFNDGISLATVRTSEYWEGYLHARFGQPQFTLIAESGGKPVGYIFFGWDKPNCWLKEIGWLPGEEECVRPLVHAAVSRALASENEMVHMNLPHEPEVLAGLAEAAENIEPREPMGMMCRIINMQSLSERILPELNRRATGVPDCAISLDTEFGSLEFTHGPLGAHDPIHIPLTQLELFCLLFGIKDVEELGLAIPREAGEIARMLFPKQRQVFWLADHF